MLNVKACPWIRSKDMQSCIGLKGKNDAVYCGPVAISALEIAALPTLGVVDLIDQKDASFRHISIASQPMPATLSDTNVTLSGTTDLPRHNHGNTKIKPHLYRRAMA